MKLKIFVGAALILLLILFKNITNKTVNKINPEPNLTELNLVLDWTPNTNHTGIYVALAQGLYKKQGIDLKILPFSSDVSPVILVTNGKADVAIGSIEDIVGFNAKNNPVVSIGPILQHNTSGFMVLSDSGIKRPKDLDGKIYGGYGSIFENAVVSEIIKKDGGRGIFKSIVLDVKAMQALTSRRIDFVWGFEGWEVIQAEEEGNKVNFFPIIKYGIPDSPALAFVTTPDKMINNSDILKKFMTATAQGYEYARKNPRQSAQILIDNTDRGTFPDTQLVFKSQEVVSREYADPGRKWGLQDKNTWSGYGQFMLDSGTITDSKGNIVKKIDFDGIYSNKFLE